MRLIEALKGEKNKLARQMATIERTITELSTNESEPVKKFSKATRAKMAKKAKERWAKIKRAAK